jgi:hypothetical protein
MDIPRIRNEVAVATMTFPNVELHANGSGGVFVKALFQTSAGGVYFTEIQFANYPSEMPKVFVKKPDLGLHAAHRYNVGNICYLHPNYWNPGRHHLTFVLGRAAKWLNKYEVYRRTGKWPGAEILH